MRPSGLPAVAKATPYPSPILSPLAQAATQRGISPKSKRGETIMSRTAKAKAKAKYQREYQREYDQRPEVKAKRREYNQRPEVKARAQEYQRAYYQRHPELKTKHREYSWAYYQRRKREGGTG